MEARIITRATKRIKLCSMSLSTRQSRLSSTKLSSPKEPPPEQAIPVGGYYSWILDTSDPPTTSPPTSLHHSPPATTASPSSKQFDTKPATEKNLDPNILFSSRTVKLRERAEDISRKSKQVAGVWIPPKPTEPDDCCMSGCVNCVWDRYQDEMEEYIGAKRLADAAVKAQAKPAGGGGKVEVAPAVTSMDEDGGGSEGNWNEVLETKSKDDPFKDVPVGIREFMRLERKLKESTRTL